MNSKKISVPGARRRNGKKPEPKKPGPKKIRINNSALLKAAQDEYWQINITLLDVHGNELAAMYYRPFPPPPPIVPSMIVPFIRASLE